MSELLELLHVSMTLTALTVAVPAAILTDADIPDIAPLVEIIEEKDVVKDPTNPKNEGKDLARKQKPYISNMYKDTL